MLLTLGHAYGHTILRNTPDLFNALLLSKGSLCINPLPSSPLVHILYIHANFLEFEALLASTLAHDLTLTHASPIVYSPYAQLAASTCTRNAPLFKASMPF